MIGGGPVAAPVVFVRDRERGHRCSRRSARDHHAMRVMVALQSRMARTATRPRDRSAPGCRPRGQGRVGEAPTSIPAATVQQWRTWPRARHGAKYRFRLGHLIFTQRCILDSMSARPIVSRPSSPSCLLSHLITLSALTSTFGGIVRPICFAVLRLMMNSNFVGCSTGRSAGLAPLRILST
jgi:hypothetical protein